MFVGVGVSVGVGVKVGLGVLVGFFVKVALGVLVGEIEGLVGPGIEVRVGETKIGVLVRVGMRVLVAVGLEEGMAVGVFVMAGNVRAWEAEVDVKELEWVNVTSGEFAGVKKSTANASLVNARYRGVVVAVKRGTMIISSPISGLSPAMMNGMPKARTRMPMTARNIMKP